jgi:hypothetical protein
VWGGPPPPPPLGSAPDDEFLVRVARSLFLVPAPLISEDARAFRQITHVSRVVVEPDVTVETVTTTRVNVLDVLDTRAEILLKVALNTINQTIQNIYP